MKNILKLLPTLLLAGVGVCCQSNGETTDKIPYEKKYEYVIDIEGVDADKIYDSIPLWLNSEFPEKDINSNDAAKNFVQTFLILDFPIWADTSVQNIKRNIKNVTADNRDSGIFTCSIKNIVVETQNQAWGAGGSWLVAEADIMVQVKAEKYRILWENVNVSQLKISGNGRNTWVHQQSSLKKTPYSNLISILEGASYRLKEQIEKINQDW